MRNIKYSFLLFGIASLLACQPQSSEDVSGLQENSQVSLFVELDASKTGLDFSNTLPDESMTRNIYNFNYMYNGAGVAAGDINNDGLLDLYFVGNNVPDRLYLNEGNFKFKDISEGAGISAAKGWRSGVQFVDLNGDGYEDIYITRGGWDESPELHRNLLYINQGDGTFKEEARYWGIDDPGYGIDASFFDFDLDGDLDLYISNRPGEFYLNLDKVLKGIKEQPALSRDRLYRNEGNFKFKDITEEAGIDANYGYGLSVTTADINGDHLPDIYVANDFLESDYCYINQGDGSFKQSLSDHFGHVAFYSMGTDIADVNNDGLEDLLNVEMLPEDYKRSKTSMANMATDEYYAIINSGRHHQYMHNMLQLNRGSGHYSEVSQISGLKKTDWSWACFMEDFDNDGDRDVFVANGFKRDVYDQDGIALAQELIEKHPMDKNFPLAQLLDYFPYNAQLNYLFENTGDIKFKKRSLDWGIKNATLSNGAVAADLDNDGDLDIVCNNIDMPASVYQNQAHQLGRNYIQVQLEGSKFNRHGEGATIKLHTSEGSQHFVMKRSRGYLSGLPGIAHFGLGGAQLNSLEVFWNDGRVTRMDGLTVNQRVVVRYNGLQTCGPGR